MELALSRFCPMIILRHVSEPQQADDRNMAQGLVRLETLSKRTRGMSNKLLNDEHGVVAAIVTGNRQSCARQLNCSCALQYINALMRISCSVNRVRERTLSHHTRSQSWVRKRYKYITMYCSKVLLVTE